MVTFAKIVTGIEDEWNVFKRSAWKKLPGTYVPPLFTKEGFGWEHSLKWVTKEGFAWLHFLKWSTKEGFAWLTLP